MLHFLLLLAAQDPAPKLTANEIMDRMAKSFEGAVDERRQYVYKQKATARLVRRGGQPARIERREYTVTPGPEKTEKHLDLVAGEYYKSKKEVVKYDKPGFEKGGMDIDGGIMEDLIEDLANDKKSRDGIPQNFFPLTASNLKYYKFTLKPPTTIRNRPAYVVAFEPLDPKTKCIKIGGSDEDDDDCESRPWKGEATIDAEEFQPVRIFSDLQFKMPWGVKVFLGTNIRQTGFSVNYTRVAPNVWFPVTYGTEFKLDLLFGYHRTITLAMDSADFRRADARSEITFTEVK